MRVGPCLRLRRGGKHWSPFRPKSSLKSAWFERQLINHRSNLDEVKLSRHRSMWANFRSLADSGSLLHAIFRANAVDRTPLARDYNCGGVIFNSAANASSAFQFPSSIGIPSKRRLANVRLSGSPGSVISLAPSISGTERV